MVYNMGKKYDYIVVGSGPAGHSSAITAAKMGLKTALVEQSAEMLGGVCLNEGCIPAKALYSSARLLLKARKDPAVFGPVKEPSADTISEMVSKSMRASDELKRGLRSHLEKLGIEFIEARAMFVDGGRLSLDASGNGGSVYESRNILIATGSCPRVLPRVSFDGKRVISSSEAVRLNYIPQKTLIIGAGAVGVEFACFFASMGSKVTLIEKESAVLPAEDKDLSSAMRIILKKKGVSIFTSCSLERISVNDDKVSVRFSSPVGETAEDHDTVIVSIGRVPSTSGMGLEKAGVSVDDNGYIPVDASMRTNIPGIYAAGDVVPGPMLAHVAQVEGEQAAFAAAGKDPEPIDYTSIPNAVYTDIQAASVGFTQERAESMGAGIVTGKSFFKANGKAVASGESEGFVKIVADGSTRSVLGAHIVGAAATEMIHEFALARRKGLTVDDIAMTVHAHPTFSESASLAAKEILFKLG